MLTYDLPVSPVHLKALEGRKKMLDAMPKGFQPTLPEALRRDASACDQLYAESYAFYAAANAAYTEGDTSPATTAAG